MIAAEHRHAVASEGNRITYRCGCVNGVDAASGVLRSVEKCPTHKAAYREPADLGEAYYRELGIMACDARGLHLAQLADAMGLIPLAGKGARAVEIGCGASSYAGAIRDAGYSYLGLDQSRWACEWTAATYGVETIETAFGPDALTLGSFDLVFAAHVLEHFGEAPAAVDLMAGLLTHGGELWLIVPDDSDPLNPDHLWFFDERTLRGCLERAGLQVVTLVSRKHIEREAFIYARARKH
jgi:SAM-dependent methyltransferase